MFIEWIIEFIIYIVVLSLSFVYHFLIYLAIVVYLGGLILALKSLKNKHTLSKKIKSFEYPSVTIVVPSYNESKTIIRSIEGIKNLNYPLDKLEIFFIDDSDDNTFEIIKRETDGMPNVHLIKNKKRMGKGYALNLAYKKGHGEFIVVFDADNRAHPDCLIHLITSFDDSSVWAIQGSYDVYKVNLLSKIIDGEYAVWQTLEEPSFTFIHGYNYCVRRSVLDEIGPWRDDILSEDTELSVRIYKNGGKIKYVPDAKVEILEPTSLDGIAKQRIRWFHGTYQSYQDYEKGILIKLLTPPDAYVPKDGRVTALLSYVARFTIIPGLGIMLILTILSALSSMIWEVPLILFLLGYVDVLVCLKRFDKLHLIPILPFLPFFGLYEIYLFVLSSKLKKAKWIKVDKG